ncbi:hypothetical protein DFQ28_010738 [Apophysomyces sp. BC1034]|nr:hypothetical protein DFQ30_010491 [Apophysomyces sp. BC1015]KAG0182713.1 hypothetical protein DFQ29_002633 [Apophysomyces sp. BC1021]KAG0191877.1 hypothetical protein DFQ28_010738 [Apophysomyces sp. BC1034]
MDSDTRRQSSTPWLKQRPRNSSISEKPRRVDRELERIKSLGVVSKTFTPEEPTTPSSTSSTGTLDQSSSITYTDTRRTSICSSNTVDTNPPQEEVHHLEKTRLWDPPVSFEDPHARIEYLEQRHTDDLKLLNETQNEIKFYKEQLLQQDQTMKHTVASYLEQKELESIKVRQLSEIIVKQDRLIAELEHHHPTSEIHTLRQELVIMREAKQELIQMITSLRGELEMSQSQTRLMMLVSTEIQNTFDKQKANINQNVEALQQELQQKEDLLRQYQQQRQTQSPIDNPMAVRPRTNSTSTFGSSLCHLEEEIPSGLSYASSQRSQSSIPKLVQGSRRRSSSSRRSSINISSNSGSPRRSYIAKWSGSAAIPPPTPPPNDPLPPVPTIDLTRSHRSLSPPRSIPSLVTPPPGVSAVKHASVDVVSTQPTHAANTTSMLRVEDWPQSREGTKWMDDPESAIEPVRSRSSTSVSEKQRSAFWKGMKKKWMVRS